MAPKIKVTEQVYTAVKLFLDNGATQAEVKKFYDIGGEICTRIKMSKDYNDFLKTREEKNKKNLERYHAKKEPKKEIVLDKTYNNPAPLNAKDFYIVNRIMQAAEEQTELLKSISNKLAYIVEQLS